MAPPPPVHPPRLLLFSTLPHTAMSTCHTIHKADPGRSIPKGTLAAIATVTVTYLVFVWLFGTILSNEVLIADKLVASRVAWPTHYLVSVGKLRFVDVFFFFFWEDCFPVVGLFVFVPLTALKHQSESMSVCTFLRNKSGHQLHHHHHHRHLSARVSQKGYC